MVKKLINAIKERIREMTMARSTKAQNWSWSRVFTAEEMTGTNARRTALDSSRSDWEAAAAASGYKVKKDAAPTESISPLWRGADGNWTEASQGDNPVEGYKVTISGPIS